jgi:hypothetical protein
MRKGFVVPLAVGLTIAVTAKVASAASLLDFDKWMQSIDKRTQHLHRSLDDRDARAAAEDARAVQGLYQSLEDFFTTRGRADDAVQLSKDGQELAGTVVQSLERDDYEAASKAARGITSSCSTCHNAYKPFK